MNFYAGNNPDAQGIYWEAPFVQSAEPKFEKEDYRLEASRNVGRDLGIVEASRYWLNQGLNFIVHFPAAYLILLLKKFFLFFHSTEIPNNLSIYAAMEFSRVLRYIPFSFGLLAPIGLVMWLMRLKKSNFTIIHLYGLSYLLATILFFAASEYRLPVLLILLPCTAAGIKKIFEDLKKARWKSVLMVVSLAVLLTVAVNMPPRFTDNLRTARMDYFNLGSVLQKYDRHKDAASMLQKALIYDPDFTEAHRLLGDSYHALKLRQQAIEEFQRVGLDTDKALQLLDAEELMDKAQSQALSGDLHGAWQSYAEATSFHPNPPAFAFFNMAYISLQLGDTVRALDELKLTSDADPYEPRAPFLQGLIYENRGDWEPALERFLAAMERNAKFHLPRVHAALVCLEIGDKQQAASLIEPLVGKFIKDPELADLVEYIASQVGYFGVRKP